MCSASTRRNWSFHDSNSPRRVSSRRKHCYFHYCASWRSCAISSSWCLCCVVECGEKEGGEREVSWVFPKEIDGMNDLRHK
jgi:hypothetical protein